MIQVLKANWSAIADGTATGITAIKGLLRAVKDGYIWDEWSNGWVTDENPEKNTIIATRPKPPLTPEQKQAIEDYCEWADSQPFAGRYAKTYFEALEDE